jgi:hypothetical protein
MGQWCSNSWVAALVIAASLGSIGGCGGSKPPGASVLPAKINLAPATSVSLEVGSVLTFTATAQNAANGNVTPVFTFQSSNTDILNLAANGVACAGRWDAAFTTCTPGASGIVQVTASALGTTSAPTLVFVHPPIDNIQISLVIPVNAPPPACPGQQNIPAACVQPFTPTSSCLSNNQTITLQAQAYSRGNDITGVVGPFTWSESSPTVVTVTPITTSTSNVPTNQATVKPGAPGFTPVYATASDVSSQPYYAETCPVQCIAMELGPVGSVNTNQTKFSTNKGTAENASATAVDVQGCIVAKPPLTWISSQPASVIAGTATSGCPAGSTCSIATPSPGAGSVTASCTPPTCNVGFPQDVTTLPQALVRPFPVYPVTPITGSVSGAVTATSVLATSLDCAANVSCNVNLYNVSTSTNLAGNAFPIPTVPNSIVFDPAGDKAYMGSAFGAQSITVANFGSSNSAFTSVGSVTGKVLAVSENGSLAIFSDTSHTPNQVYFVSANGASYGSAALTISGAIAAGFSPDGLKSYVLGDNGNTLYVYSLLQYLTKLSLPAPANAVAFSSNGAFAFVSGGAAAPAISVYAVCDNSSAATIPLTGAAGIPTYLKALPDANHLIGFDSTGFDYITTSVTAAPFPSLCPQTITGTSQYINLQQGPFDPIAFFLSPDGTQVYVVASDRSIVLVYNFNSGSVSGIPLAGNTTPVSADMTVDGTLIYVAASDGTLHVLNTLLATDMQQISFPPTSTTTNGFCSLGGSTTACKLNLVAVKP